jgi:hypothetical protein
MAMDQYKALLTPEERARITELQDLLIDRYVEHREAVADGRAAKHLHNQAERCFRLASGPAGPRLADELEALGRAFEREASEFELANRLHSAGSHAAGL